MSLYSEAQQENIHIDKKGRELLRSRLIAREQYGQLRALVADNLKTTGLFFRLLYFIFALIFLFATVSYIVQFFNLRNSLALSFIFFLFGGGAYFVAEWLIKEQRLYRCGIEEGFALGAAVLIITGLNFGLTPLNLRPELIGSLNSLAAAALYFWFYRRFTFLYAAFMGIYFLAGLPFQLHLPEISGRILLIALLTPMFYWFARADQNSLFEFQKENHQFIQSVIIFGIYFAINLALPGFSLPLHPFPPVFYWPCFGLSFIFPALVLLVGLRDKNRAFIDIGILALIISLCTTKSFLGMKYQAWDPVLLGSILIAAGFLVEWLVMDEKHSGYTAKNILKPENYGIDLSAIGAIASIPSLPQGSPQPFSGGSSGGAGASRQF